MLPPLTRVSPALTGAPTVALISHTVPAAGNHRHVTISFDSARHIIEWQMACQ